MKRENTPPEGLQQDLHLLGQRVEELLGLAFSEKRSRDLWNALLRMAPREKSSPEDLLRRILREGISEDLERDFAQHLTIGETYFFREPRTLEALEKEILPLFPRERSPRIWCAGCSTGEEPYTLAMTLYGPQGRPLPERPSIFGTDINPQALQKARQGVYTSWSFRNVPEMSKHLFFEPLEKSSFAVKPPFRKAVSFSLCNLFAPLWPLWEKNPPPEIIFCRNVLIYFTESSRKRLLERFYALLPPSGWLVVAPCETSALAESLFTPHYAQGVTLYRKEGPEKKKDVFPFALPRAEPEPKKLFLGPEEGRALSMPPLLPLLGEESLPDAAPFSLPTPRQPEEQKHKREEHPQGEERGHEQGREDLLAKARKLANQGKHPEALKILEDLLRKDRTDAFATYLKGLVHAETGEEQQAGEALRKALFLEPHFVMAHYTLGTLALTKRDSKGAARHFRNAAQVAASLPPGTLLFEGEGLSREDLLKMLEKRG
jgi:chemotaxis protein methyltransferase CheR